MGRLENEAVIETTDCGHPLQNHGDSAGGVYPCQRSWVFRGERNQICQ